MGKENRREGKRGLSSIDRISDTAGASMGSDYEKKDKKFDFKKKSLPDGESA
ncbi:predicted protein [Sclerotinia sclerotiorum 1980 UF-70]|uniref:Uncharacterized protein n=2 Tax=Sclerotinia sclerotiorum (strain ATCC 18683 / 1980 / Ss-1) TaxID=665079 RepID=A7F8L9_SCLS1|nr:predicted protein [Sclerotinia sclerotiorum 1980 UF-70]APA13849.1 hypothetical protein sscle_11g086190 [Sclerotinia sclerotiorum 1980 UF-70]EDN99090.1 predicted protein [Sclerotinia sclerotiorum 1980 UF-70]